MPLSATIKLVYLHVAKVRCLNVYMSAKESVKNLMNDEIEMRLLLRVSPSYGLERREWHNAGWAFQRTVNTRIRTTLPYPGLVSRKSPQAAHLTTAVSMHRLRARLLLIDGMKVDCDAPLKVLSLMHVPEHSLKIHPGASHVCVCLAATILCALLATTLGCGGRSGKCF